MKNSGQPQANGFSIIGASRIRAIRRLGEQGYLAGHGKGLERQPQRRTGGGKQWPRFIQRQGPARYQGGIDGAEDWIGIQHRQCLRRTVKGKGMPFAHRQQAGHRIHFGARQHNGGDGRMPYPPRHRAWM
jgi:hypothetical protein